MKIRCQEKGQDNQYEKTPEKTIFSGVRQREISAREKLEYNRRDKGVNQIEIIYVKINFQMKKIYQYYYTEIVLDKSVRIDRNFGAGIVQLLTGLQVCQFPSRYNHREPF